ncbi:MAG: helix-turn-helix domain-containing protein [Paracoccaceae bacterium]
MDQSARTRDQAALPILPQVWETDAAGPGEAFDFYREGICAAFMPLRPEIAPALRRDFRASVRSYDLGRAVLNLVSARSHEVNRGRAEIAASPEDCLYLNFQIGGTCHIRQRGQEVTLRPGDLGVFDASRGFVLDHSRAPGLKVASLMVPKALLGEGAEAGLGAGPRLLSAHPGFGRLAAQAAQTLFETVRWSPAGEAGRLLGVVLSLAQMAVGQQGEAGQPGTRAAAQLYRVKEIIRSRCAAPGYGVADCAAEAGLSVRYVHRLFAREGERFGDALRRARLDLARHLLTGPAHRHAPVATIAALAGFCDASHFARVFRAEEGMSPGQWRQDRRAGG